MDGGDDLYKADGPLGRKALIAAIYGSPKGGRKLPGLVQVLGV